MNNTWRVGNWLVNIEDGWLRSRGGALRRRVYPDGRVMSVLAALMTNPGQMISTEEILAAAWPGRVVTRDSVCSAVYELRQLLGDDSASPTYIRTVRGHGYRLIARVEQVGKHRHTWIFSRAGQCVGILAALGLIVLANPHAPATIESPKLYVVPLENVTGNIQLDNISVAMDATLFSALVRRNPSAVAARLDDEKSLLRLESSVVACDFGPVLVVRLLDVANNHYVWSRSYPLHGGSSEPSVVEHVAREVTTAMRQT